MTQNKFNDPARRQVMSVAEAHRRIGAVYGARYEQATAAYEQKKADKEIRKRNGSFFKNILKRNMT